MKESVYKKLASPDHLAILAYIPMLHICMYINMRVIVSFISGYGGDVLLNIHLVGCV